MDIIKLRDKLTRLSPQLRNQILSDTIAWLEAEERPKCKSEHIDELVKFETELQELLNQTKLNEAWFVHAAHVFGSFPFFERFVKRVL